MKFVYLSLVFAAGYFLLPASLKQHTSPRPLTAATAAGPQEAAFPPLPIKHEQQETVESTPIEAAPAPNTLAVDNLTQVAAIDELPASVNQALHVQISAAADGIPALMQHLSRSIRVMEMIPSYTATLEQQVRKRDRLLDPEWIDLKLRRSPFSVYLKWQEDDQELVYVEGMNDGRLLVHPTKGFASLRSMWKIRPDSQQAMKDSRYPLTEIGIEKLSRMALNFYQQEVNKLQDAVCISSPVLADGRPATRFEVRFASPSVSPEYAVSRLTFDHETNVLVSLETDTWNSDGKPGELLERYRYHKMTPRPELSDLDFSDRNPDYHFHK